MKQACPHTVRNKNSLRTVKPFCLRWQSHKEAALSLVIAASDSDDNNARHILSQLRTGPCAPHSRGRHGLSFVCHVQRPCGAYINGIIMTTTTQTSSTKTTNGALDGESPWVKTWVINYADSQLKSVLPEGCRFRLVASDENSPPGFYRLEFDGNDMTAYWSGLILQAIPGTPPRMENLPPWDKNDSEVKARYDECLHQFRELYSNNFSIERLQGGIRVEDKLEIVCLYLFAGAQSNGRDWLVIDVLVPTRQGGYGHGEPYP